MKIETVMSSNAVESSGGTVHLWRRLVGCSMHVTLPLSPSDDWRVNGTSNMGAAAECRRQRSSTSVVRWSISARYDGAVSWRQRYARTHNRNCILSGTRNQWSSQSRGVMCSDFILGWATGRTSCATYPPKVFCSGKRAGRKPRGQPADPGSPGNQAFKRRRWWWYECTHNINFMFVTHSAAHYYAFSGSILLVGREETIGPVKKLEMWANDQRDGRPAEHRWCLLFNADWLGFNVPLNTL